MPRAWSFLVIFDRQHGGNEGYDDQVGNHYSFDSTVPNAARIEKGDIAVLRDDTQLLGLRIITTLTSTRGMKKRRRCPECATTGFKKRSTMRPTYRCDRKHTFDTPSDEMISVIRYRAAYWESWVPLRKLLSAEQLEAITPSNARQHSIRQLGAVRLQRALGDAVPRDIWLAFREPEPGATS